MARAGSARRRPPPVRCAGARSARLDRARPRHGARCAALQPFVTLMKRALPIAAGAILAAVVVYSLLPRQSDKHHDRRSERCGMIENDLAMIKPRLTGTDDDGNPFVITADIAIQEPQEHPPRHAEEGRGRHDARQDGRWMNATADAGLLRHGQGHCSSCTGGIAVFSDDGYELHTAHARRRSEEGPVSRPEHGDRPRARSARCAPTASRSTDIKQLLHLTGNVHMTILDRRGRIANDEMRLARLRCLVAACVRRRLGAGRRPASA